MRRRQLVTADEVVSTPAQHTKPCDDCPWSRASLPGWLGSMTAEEWLKAAHGDGRIDCHTLASPGGHHQCAGAAIYRRNVAKLPHDRAALRLEADRERVFKTPQEFTKHHEGDAMPTKKKEVKEVKKAEVGTSDIAEGLLSEINNAIGHPLSATDALEIVDELIGSLEAIKVGLKSDIAAEEAGA